ncbi:MAG: DUF1385 domain-containing protein [Chloroflexota bacterium]
MSFHYGGQAVMEGVMMRGQRHMAVAVRKPSGDIIVHSEPLNAAIYTHPFWKLPFARGLVLLWDTLVLGIRMIMYSAAVALEEEEVQLSGPVIWGTLFFALALAVGVFFVAPLLLTSFADRYIASSLVSNVVEGAVRIAFFVGYIALIGLLPDIRRVFAYHGAEHKAINAYEAGEPLEAQAVERYGTAHPRCGTSFLLVVLVACILVFALLGRPPMFWRVLSRIALVPVVAAISYEFMKLAANNFRLGWVRAAMAPGLSLQSLTTREPDRSQIEVAITALKKVLALDGVISEEPQAEPSGNE